MIMEKTNCFEEIRERTKWFMDARFGMFIHFGLYSAKARGEWQYSYDEETRESFEKDWQKFDPKKFNADEWAEIAADAGCKYAVLTTKHHEGFCLFDSAYTDFKSTNTAAKRDFVREYTEAFRKRGMKVGLYYSLFDWHNPDFDGYKDRYHPRRNDPSSVGGNFDNYLKYLHNQVEELLTNYGKIDILWLDFSYNDMIGEKWKATELVRMIREKQPGIIINSRLEGSGEKYGSITTDHPTYISGDFTCPEMIIPPEGVRTESGRAVPWEACFTMNNTWGYNLMDNYYKTPATLIKKLIECVSKNGNMILNVAPDGNGSIPKKQREILHKIGEWLAENGESIYGCGKSDFPKPEYGRFTQNGKNLYVHIYEQQVGPVPLIGMKGKVTDAYRLSDGAQLHVSDSWVTKEFPEDEFICYDKDGIKAYTYADDSRVDVIRLRLK